MCNELYWLKRRGIITTESFTPRLCQREEGHEGEHGPKDED
jgi:hypothetical protein